MPIKLIIIGGVAGGATAAARARRLDETADILLFEKGEYISFANCGLPYYIGGVIKKRESLLVTTPADFSARYRIDIRIFSEVTQIDPLLKRVSVTRKDTGETYTESYDKIILAPGAEPIAPPLDGIDSDKIFTLRTVPDSDRIKAFIEQHRPQKAVIVGAGFIGIEMADMLTHRGVKVILIERLSQVMTPLDVEMAAMVQDYLEAKGVTCDMDNSVTAFKDEGAYLTVATQKGPPISCDLALLSVGIKPENKLAKEAGLALNAKGGIVVDASLRTSDPHIYAVGDAVEIQNFVTGHPTMIPLAGPANKQGRIAADNVLGRKSVYKGALGTSVVKVFDMTAASTGANEKNLKELGIPFLKSYTHSASHATYYPNAAMMAVKLLFSPADGQILGAQIIGMDGVDKRIDVLATAIFGKMTVFDLEELELSYAPPYSSAKDPVNIAGYVGANLLKNDFQCRHWEKLPHPLKDDQVLIDVRTPIEIKNIGEIPGAWNIPLHELRGKLSRLDKKKRYLVTCAIGLRGYLACRILTQHGFKAQSLSGGFKTYQYTSLKN